MQFYVLGASIFFFGASIALYFHSYSLLNRAIYTLRYTLQLVERLDTHEEMYRKEGTE